MRWIKNVFGKQQRSNKAAEIIFGNYGGTAAGKTVTADTALSVSTVWACVRVLSETIGSLPIHVYRRLPNGGKERVVDHPVARLLALKPNTYQTSVTFFEQMQAQCSLRGNSYAQKIYNKKNEIKELIPIDAERVEPELTGQKIIYKIRPIRGNPIVLTDQDIFHVPALVISGVKGKSPIDVARESLGLAMAAEEHGARFFGNGAVPMAVLEHPGVLGKDALQNLKNMWKETYGGSKNAYQTAILEEGMKLTQLTLSNEQSQFIESRRFQVVEICRWFRMQPHMIGHLDNATFSNIEQQSLEFVTYTLRPWLVRWEKALTVSLLTPEEQEEFFVEFLVDGLLRGDTFTRFQAYKLAIDGGWMNRDEVRELENRSPIPDGEGQEFMLTPPGATDVNLKEPASSEAPAVVEDDEPEEEETDRSSAKLCQFLNLWEPMTRELTSRAIRKAKNAYDKAARNKAENVFMAGFADTFREDFAIVMIPIFESFNRQLRATTKFMIIEGEDLFSRYWAELVERREKIREPEIEPFYRASIEVMERVLVGAYRDKDQPPAPIIQVHIENKPLDVNVKIEQPSIVRQEIELKRDATGRPVGGSVIREFAKNGDV